MKVRILLLEDDISLGETLCELLSNVGYDVVWKETIKEAREEINSHLDLAILDVGLPDGSGMEFSKELDSNTPFIFLTALNSAEDRLEGYERGANEYIPKPFHLKELLLRIDRVLLTRKDKIGSTIKIENFILDLEAMTLFQDDEVKSQLKLRGLSNIRVFNKKAPRIISRDELLNEFWGKDNFPSTRTIDNTIVRLRNLFGDKGDEWIKSIRAVGYQWNKKI